MEPYLGAQILAILGQPAQLLMALLEMRSLGLHQPQHLGPRGAGGRAEETPRSISPALLFSIGRLLPTLPLPPLQLTNSMMSNFLLSSITLI